METQCPSIFLRQVGDAAEVLRGSFCLFCLQRRQKSAPCATLHTPDGLRDEIPNRFKLDALSRCYNGSFFKYRQRLKPLPTPTPSPSLHLFPPYLGLPTTACTPKMVPASAAGRERAAASGQRCTPDEEKLSRWTGLSPADGTSFGLACRHRRQKGGGCGGIRSNRGLSVAADSGESARHVCLISRSLQTRRGNIRPLDKERTASHPIVETVHDAQKINKLAFR